MQHEMQHETGKNCGYAFCRRFACGAGIAYGKTGIACGAGIAYGKTGIAYGKTGIACGKTGVACGKTIRTGCKIKKR